MAVLNHFSGCRWTLDQVGAGITGRFPGLAALYGTEAKQDRLLELWHPQNMNASAPTPQNLDLRAWETLRDAHASYMAGTSRSYDEWRYTTTVPKPGLRL
jgi:hypothetical protein